MILIVEKRKILPRRHRKRAQAYSNEGWLWVIGRDARTLRHAPRAAKLTLFVPLLSVLFEGEGLVKQTQCRTPDDRGITVIDANSMLPLKNALPLKNVATRFAAMFFALVLACSLVPSSAFADGASAQGGAAASGTPTQSDAASNTSTQGSAALNTSAQGDAIAIVFTNDVHCSIDEKTSDGVKTNAGYVGVASIADSARATYGEANVELVDAGDAVQGGPVGTLTKGKAIVDIMNAAQYDYAVPGNHEFDYGMDRFNELVKASKATYLSCNFTDLRTGQAPLGGYAIETYEGVTHATNDADGVVKVAYVGITTPETLTKSSPVNFQDESGNYVYGFCQDETGAALYARVQASVNAARVAGADYVVAIGHLGESGITDRWTSEAVIANTTGIDAMIDGHSHETYSQVVQNGQGEDVVLAQTGTKLANVGELIIDPDAKDGKDISVAVTPASQVETGTGATAEAVKSAVAKVNEDLNEELNTVVGKSEVDLKSEDAATGLYVRWQETNLGDFVADAYRARLGADVGLVNGGGVRASLSAGEITNGNLLAVQPFGNELCLVEVTGQTLLDALEMGVRKLPDYSGGFLQVSGVRFSVNASIPSSVVTDENGNFVSVEGQRRVSNVMVGDEALDLDKTYTVASHAYMLLQGGDGMVMFKDANVLLESVMLDNQALIEYVTEDLKGVIGQEYANPEGQGRIVITEEPSDPDDGGDSGDAGAGDGGDSGDGSDAGDGSGGGTDSSAANASDQASFLPKTSDTMSDAANAAAAIALFAALASVLAATRIARKTRSV